ncbi:hypothetical protein J6590_076203 [Homalodisca vitripennis]|nr:hypothetical protein J6590_076203 [Homalodisca vitripennis]
MFKKAAQIFRHILSENETAKVSGNRGSGGSDLSVDTRTIQSVSLPESQTSPRNTQATVPE